MKEPEEHLVTGHGMSKGADIIDSLRQPIVKRNAEIRRLPAELADAQRHLPWIIEVCGDDLW